MIYILILLLITSCISTINPVTHFEESNSKITFNSPVVSLSTRTDLYEIPNNSYIVQNNMKYPTNWNFCISSVWNDEQNEIWNEEPNGDDLGSLLYMNKVECGFDNSEDVLTWVPLNEDYFWPKNGYLYFQGFSPSSISDKAILDENGLTINNYIISTDGTQCDLMYSDRAINQTKSVAIDRYIEESAEGVDINFRHALASIQFKAKLFKPEGYPGSEIVIKEIYLKNVYNQGTFKQNFNDVPFNISGCDPVWIVNDYNTTSYDNLVISDYLVTPVATIPNTKDLLVMPQDFIDTNSGNPTSVVVKYTITSSSGVPIDQIYEQDLNTLTYRSGDEIQGKYFKVGRLYIYTLIFDLQLIRFSPEVTDWIPVTLEAQAHS